MRHFRRCFFVLGAVALIDGEITTLTTTSAAVTSARPTTLLRIIDVRKEDFDFNNTEDFFQRSELRLRRKLGNIHNLWNWDHWCLLQPKTGNCGPRVTKYYYNAQMNQCQPHPYTGCKTKGNENEFKSIEDCENHCQGATMMPESLPEDANICELQPISGRCMSYDLLYYYDVNEAACKSFAYGGCAGNQNKFDSVEECNNRCSNPVQHPTPANDESASDSKNEDSSWQ